MTYTDVSAPPIPVIKPWLGDEEAAAASAAIVSGWVAQGPRVAAFEEAVAAKVGAAHGVAVSSCTTGLHLALIAAGVGAGDDVIVPSLSFIATANVVRYVNATPVFADVDATTQNLTVDTIMAAVTPSTRAVILVHQAGVPADIAGIQKTCADRGIVVIEDAACAIGASYRGAPIGGHSDFVVFSFHPRKVITTGEGGMVMTSDAEAAQRLRRLREHGMSVSAAERHATDKLVVEQYLETGFNYRMTDVQAAIGLVQLGRLDGIVTRRRALAARYHKLLGGIHGVRMIHDPVDGQTNYQSFWLVLPDDAPRPRNEVLNEMLRHSIGARRGIMAAHLEPAYAGIRSAPLPVTEDLTTRSLILPMFHTMTVEEQERVVDGVVSALQEPNGRL